MNISSNNFSAQSTVCSQKKHLHTLFHCYYNSKSRLKCLSQYLNCWKKIKILLILFYIVNYSFLSPFLIKCLSIQLLYLFAKIFGTKISKSRANQSRFVTTFAWKLLLIWKTWKNDRFIEKNMLWYATIKFICSSLHTGNYCINYTIFNEMRAALAGPLSARRNRSINYGHYCSIIHCRGFSPEIQPIGV